MSEVILHRENLLKLSSYLLDGDTEYEFSMTDFQSESACGTAACAVGHGPSAGIRKEVGCWYQYSLKFIDPTISAEWDWCFGWGWSEVDDTSEGAGKRILYLLIHGLPDNWKDQMSGEAPLCYTEIDTEIKENILLTAAMSGGLV